MKHNFPLVDICGRIAQVRLELVGPRGKSLFAKKLGLSASTYSYYESSRIPPADVLVRIAEVAEVDLAWLLTGEAGAAAAVPADHPALKRAARLLADHPDAAGPLRAFVEILGEALQFPDKAADQSGPTSPAEAAAAGVAATTAPAGQADSARPSESKAAPAADQAGDPPPESWIPVLGRSAAGVLHFWADDAEAAGTTMLGDLVARYAARTARQVRPARASGDEAADCGSVQIISLSEPQGDAKEFIAAAALKGRYPDAFAVKIDGESMTPELRHGDLAILSPSVPATSGRIAVVQLARQIGVTCKLYRPVGRTVHLVPINEQFPPATVPADQVIWALRVIALVRP